ncbi:unnamed protein product [Prunus armeniaca]|uniref:Uncharacterized protein n=1 Tax=Prunus armeniaca TaxID=36596 RepID=A0A6J5VQ57_PRUAR|nr:unnamed protein product [Prunus armeniaca]CAB4318417.1 unnamed protein product [Prunus armeniaca]
MDVFVALGIKVKNPDQYGSNSKRHINSAVPLTSTKSSGADASDKCRNKIILYYMCMYMLDRRLACYHIEESSQIIHTLIVDNSDLGSSDEVTNLLERVEATVVQNFSNPNRREGMKLLRPKATREKRGVTFFTEGRAYHRTKLFKLKSQGRYEITETKSDKRKTGCNIFHRFLSIWSMVNHELLARGEEAAVS